VLFSGIYTVQPHNVSPVTYRYCLPAVIRYRCDPLAAKAAGEVRKKDTRRAIAEDMNSRYTGILLVAEQSPDQLKIT